MNELKNKSTILLIAALIIVCGGSFLGVRAVNKGLEDTAAPVVSYVPESSTTTTAPVQTTTQQPSVQVDMTMPTSSNVITTFAGISDTTSAVTTIITTASTTQVTAPAFTIPTTATTTSATTAATTSATTTAAAVTSGSQSSNGAMFDNGLGGYKFNSDGNYYFTADDPWQRNFGYTEAFDTAAPFVSIYMDTMRAKFRYGNKDWMIQFWKGQYGLAFIGSEIGVYTKPLDRGVAYYDAASNDEALYMSCTCYRNGEPLFSREYGKYWWCTGFVPGQLANFSNRSELAVKCRITMKDSNMLLAFTNALKSAPNNLVEGKHYAVNGLDVFVTWQ